MDYYIVLFGANYFKKLKFITLRGIQGKDEILVSELLDKAGFKFSEEQSFKFKITTDQSAAVTYVRENTEHVFVPPSLKELPKAMKRSYWILIGEYIIILNVFVSTLFRFKKRLNI